MIEHAHQRGGIRRAGDHVEVARGRQAVDKIAARRRAIRVDHRSANVLHIETECIPEHQDQQQRDHEGQVKAAEIADQVQVFLAGDGFDVAQVHEARSPIR